MQRRGFLKLLGIGAPAVALQIPESKGIQFYESTEPPVKPEVISTLTKPGQRRLYTFDCTMGEDMMVSAYTSISTAEWLKASKTEDEG